MIHNDDSSLTGDEPVYEYLRCKVSGGLVATLFAYWAETHQHPCKSSSDPNIASVSTHHR